MYVKQLVVGCNLNVFVDDSIGEIMFARTNAVGIVVW